ncbi:hypothetical protein EV567_2662 [Streptomyces sp. BK239]|nr:hypothetical protein EV567_2662 [Streptomyces sp. BK239]
MRGSGSVRLLDLVPLFGVARPRGPVRQFGSAARGGSVWRLGRAGLWRGRWWWFGPAWLRGSVWWLGLVVPWRGCLGRLGSGLWPGVSGRPGLGARRGFGWHAGLAAVRLWFRRSSGRSRGLLGDVSVPGFARWFRPVGLPAPAGLRRPAGFPVGPVRRDRLGLAALEGAGLPGLLALPILFPEVALGEAQEAVADGAVAGEVAVGRRGRQVRAEQRPRLVPGRCRHTPPPAGPRRRRCPELRGTEGT